MLKKSQTVLTRWNELYKSTLHLTVDAQVLMVNW
jgi:hypothetical protein